MGNKELNYLKVKSVKPAGNADVYNMTVENTHNFSAGGGIILHNCDGAFYGLLIHHTNKTRQLPSEKTDLQKHKEKALKRLCKSR
jgi:hypothetical protein